MDKYTYSASDASGKIIKGLLEADSEESAEEILRYNKLRVVEIKPYFSFEERLVAMWDGIFKRITPKDKAIFSRQLSTMVGAGLTLMESLKSLVRQTPNKNLVVVILKIVGIMEKGKTFSGALAQFPNVFSPIYVSMVQSGEMSGKLDNILKQLADQTEGEYKLKSRIRGALIYPAFLLFVVLAVGIFAMTSIVPTLSDTFKQFGSDLPIMTKILVSTSNFLISYWYLIIIVVIAIIVALRLYFSTVSGKLVIAYLNLKTPIFKKINIGLYSAVFARTLSLLISGGVPIVKALMMVSNSMGNVLVEQELKDDLLAVEKGIPLSEPLGRSAYFPKMVSSLISVGEKTGQLDQVLLNVANIYEEETNELTKNLSALIEPVILIIVGLGVAALVIAIIMPIFQLSNVM